MIKVGIIGYGYSTKTFHIPLIEASQQFDLVAISSSQSEVVKDKYPFITVFRTAAELISNAIVDLIVIAAPNQAHYSLAKSCMQQGLHVILEKPMVTNSLQGQLLVEFAKKYSVILSVFHNRRWDGDFLTVKKLLNNMVLGDKGDLGKKGGIGDIRYFESHFDRFRPVVRKRWKEESGPGGGIWFDLGSHLVDQAICLFGLPDSVTGRCLTSRENSEVTDYFHVILHYKQFEAVLHASSFAAGPNRRFYMEGTKGSFIKYGFDPQEEQLKKGISPSEKGFGAERPQEYGTLYHENKKRQVETEVGCYQHFYVGIANAIKNGIDCPVNCEDAINVIKILELAEESSRAGSSMPLNNLLFNKIEN